MTGTVSLGDTIDVVPVSYIDGIIQSTALMRVGYPTLSDGSSDYT